MPRVLVTDRAHEMLLRMAQTELNGIAARRSDGRWRVMLSDELYDALQATRFLNESLSECIIRFLPTLPLS